MLRNLLFIFACVTFLNTSLSQFTEVYATGQGSGDAWTGWTVNHTNSPYQNINGVQHYTFTLGTVGEAFSIELSRQFTITGTPINVEYTVFAQSANLELLYSTDNTNWTSIETNNFGSTFSSAAYNTQVTPLVGTYYLKLKLSGTIGSNQSANFTVFKISESSANTIGLIKHNIESAKVFVYNNELKVQYPGENYTISVYDISGKEILTENNLTERNLSHLVKGVYFVKIQDNQTNKFKTKKIILS